MIRSLLTTILATLQAFVAAAALAAPVGTGHVVAELVAGEDALVPGSKTTIALRLAIEPGWHTYWRNPGESGLPTTLAWQLPPGYAAGEIVWPAPRALPAGPLVNYGYMGEIFHLVPLTVPASAESGSEAALSARAEWLVCKETCIPEGADLSLRLPIASSAGPSRWQRAITATQAALPRPLPAGWHAQAVANGSRIDLELTGAGSGDAGQLFFFADQERRIEASAPQTSARAANGHYRLSLPVSHDLDGSYPRLQGVLTADRGFAGPDATLRAVALDIPIAGTPVPGPKPVEASVPLSLARGSTQATTLPIALAFAFAGGLLLNLMPCVFPVLSLKALALASSGHDRHAAHIEAGAFAAGVVGAFLLLGIALAGLRAAGEQLGWGFQLQSPAVVTALALLFFVMALNLSGLFEFGSFVSSRVASWTHANRHANAFASGLLAVAIASPCTAPFMGAALGYALAEHASVTLAVFAALGIGMSLPFVALAWFPAWRRALPRPGPWMAHLKQLLAFPLYATVAWLVWVLGAQVGNDAVMRIGIALVLVAFALWAWRGWHTGARNAWAAAAATGAVAAAVVAWPLFGGERLSTTSTEAGSSFVAAADGWEPYSAQRLAELTAQGRPVFVDFTAAWCITCQVNKRLVLTDARVRSAFERAGVALLRADWTRRDPAITQALTALGRSGVPVYALYGRSGTVRLLPELLQDQVVIDAIGSS